MCGFAGIINFENLVFCDSERLKKLSKYTVSRGPDGTRIWKKNNVGLVHSLLSIVGEIETSFQPFLSSCEQYALLFNGEIYNYKQLKENFFSDVNFLGTSDTEVLLQGLIKFGAEFMSCVEGIYAFAFFDFNNQKAFLGRDFYGTKPLYYSIRNKEFLFASELNFISQTENNQTNIQKIFHYLQYFFLEAPETVFYDVQKLLPNQIISVDLATGVVEKNTLLPKVNLRKDNQIQTKGEKYWIEYLEKVLVENLKHQTHANKDVGYLLSGGVDSSLLLAMSVKHGLTSNATRAFTLKVENGFNFDGFKNDWPYSEIVCESLGIEMVTVEPEKITEDNLRRWVRLMDEPILTPAVIGLDALCMAAHKHDFRVLISGLGADELFGGYRRHKLLVNARFIPKISETFLKKLFSMLKIKNKRFEKLKEILSSNYEKRLEVAFQWIHDDYLKILSKGVFDGSNYSINQKLTWKNILTKELNSYLAEHNLLYADRIGMKNFIEIRVPYLSTNLFEFSLSTTEYCLKYRFQSKYLLKKVAEKYLPSKIIRRSKTGFGGSLKNFFKNSEDAFWKRYFDKEFLDEQGIFDYQALNQLLKEHKANINDYSYVLLAYLGIQIWLEEYGRF
jgi:asparagine synthase (glutamine-hydrolysing)